MCQGNGYLCLCNAADEFNAGEQRDLFVAGGPALSEERKVGLAPADCLVVEDVVSGTQAGHAGGFDVACVGDASRAGAGDYNMTAFSELRKIAAE